jgi:dCTP deaminase
LSPHFIRLTRGQAIAKIEFERLPHAVTVPYTGQHGYQTEIWPISTQLYLPEKDIRRDSRIESPAVELRRAFGDDFGAMYDRLFGYGRLLLISVFVYVAFAVLLVIYAEGTGDRLPLAVNLVLGVVTNVASSVLIYFGTTPRGKRTRWFRPR